MRIFGLSFPHGYNLGQICVMIHCGSRGLGHQVATDSLVIMEKAMKRDNIIVNDRQLACARINSVEGKIRLFSGLVFTPLIL